MVDDLASFQRIAPEIDNLKHKQWCGLTEVFAWKSAPVNDIGDVVIEAFGCELPEQWLTGMAARQTPPAWINLEYLSAEAWVTQHHLLPSVHPRLGLIKTFFFPGFTPATGGLIRERDLIAPSGGCSLPLKVFMFGYDVAASEALVADIMASPTVASIMVPAGALAERLAASEPAKLRSVPFVPQPDFDATLAAHDVLIVRGEDSFVRAQWAGKPFAWQIYPQAEGAHWPKLEAFLALYCAGLSVNAEAAVRGLWNRLNGREAVSGATWQDFEAHLLEIAAHTREWTHRLRQQPDLAANLVAQVEKSLKTP